MRERHVAARAFPDVEASALLRLAQTPAKHQNTARSKGGRITPTQIEIPKQGLVAFCQRNHIRRLAFFGSVIRDDFGPDSDVDVLVEFEPGARVGLFELYDMEQELSTLLGGRKIDINTPNSLSKYFREEVLREAEVQYAQA